jgi:mitochondrial fission protein ELM1
MAIPPSPRVWALLGAHQGDNNQVLALAESLGLPFEIKPLQYNSLRHLHPPILGPTMRSLTAKSRATIAGNPPDLTISAGHRSVPVVQALRRRSRGRTRSVHIGYPRLSPARFDLVVPTPEYPVPDHPNVLRIPVALSRVKGSRPSAEDQALLKTFAGPRRLLVLGGPTLFWRLAEDDVLRALSFLLNEAAENGSSLWVIASPRTQPALLDSVRRRLESAEAPTLFAPSGGPPGYGSLLAAADSIFVTADSVAMVSDAVLTGKPVGMIPVRPTALGRAYARILGPNRKMHPRDLRFFWAGLDRQGLAGTLQQPRAGRVPDVTATVAEQVLNLLKHR